MKIYAISDLHLSFACRPAPGKLQVCPQYKPMDEVDQSWVNHAGRIFENWTRIIKSDDVVLVPGDISWAMRLDEARYDLQYLGLLPGRIVAVQGNHDYWWQSISRVRAAAPANVRFIQNDHLRLGNLVICGTRGWLCPNGAYFKPEDEKIYQRELIRLTNSLQSVRSVAADIMVIMHYMPTNEKHDYSDFIRIFQEYGVKHVVYGHLHARACRYRLPDRAWGINFYLASADYLSFTPRLITACGEKRCFDD
ncbi:metallophosphoesterase [Desulfotomaculum copahuensis]|uniref:Phosphohydrolase n=1 Tax=Desulfotomaculum copahuensis TaxID=1838280 RepID=A0A1B7LDT5_9FIRM|nr:metallophosphoesterase [Desulfotomaculum copahuensis]OAT81253.1 phosphohydrolase [Desulfotomaculum copahuensis]